MKSIIFFLTLFIGSLRAQVPATPLEQNNFEKVTSYDDLVKFINLLDHQSDILQNEIIGKSVEGRDIYAMKVSSSEFGKDESKIKVLIFAQQHGNEQSGKEGALILAENLLKPEFRYLFDRIDLALIPQVNPDGSELNQRRNANDMDLNRNHLILTEPETMALHRFFDQYLFQVSMDVHEYYLFDEEWMKYGYRKNSDITVGAITNINVSEKIRNFSNAKYLPFILKYFSDRNFSSFEYCPGGPPAETYIRHSTFDINDGRQSLGIQNTLSFIQEGMNGEDSFVQNISHRAEGQMTGMMGLLEFAYEHHKQIKKMVKSERSRMLDFKKGETISIQMDHGENGTQLVLPVVSLNSMTDSLIIIKNYRPIVNSLFEIEKPVGYLIPVHSKELTDWIQRQGLNYSQIELNEKISIEQYFINQIDSINFEGDIVVNPSLEKKEVTHSIRTEDYLYVSVEQLKGNLIVQALEPKSMLGLVTYSQFAHLLRAGELFPILRVVKKTQ
jgi:hypothetical protein